MSGNNVKEEAQESHIPSQSEMDIMRKLGPFARDLCGYCVQDLGTTKRLTRHDLYHFAAKNGLWEIDVKPEVVSDLLATLVIEANRVANSFNQAREENTVVTPGDVLRCTPAEDMQTVTKLLEHNSPELLFKLPIALHFTHSHVLGLMGKADNETFSTLYCAPLVSVPAS